MRYSKVRTIWNAKETNLILACHLKEIHNKQEKKYILITQETSFKKKKQNVTK